GPERFVASASRAASPAQLRSPGAMIISLPTGRGLAASASGGFTSGVSPVRPCSGTRLGDCALIGGSGGAATGSAAASAGLGAIGSAGREPDSPLVCSACSLTANSPRWVHHFVTFIVCQIVNGLLLTEILGSCSGRFPLDRACILA